MIRGLLLAAAVVGGLLYALPGGTAPRQAVVAPAAPSPSSCDVALSKPLRPLVRAVAAAVYAASVAGPGGAGAFFFVDLAVVAAKDVRTLMRKDCWARDGPRDG